MRKPATAGPMADITEKLTPKTATPKLSTEPRWQSYGVSVHTLGTGSTGVVAGTTGLAAAGEALAATRTR